MRVKYYHLSTSILFFILFFLATVLQVSAQTNVIKMSATKSNEYGVNYVLPKTILIINAEYNKVSMKAGIYAKYAEKYLGITTGAVFDDQTYFTLDKVELSSKGIPDKTKSFLIQLESKTFAPFVYLTKEGLVCTINAEYQLPENPVKAENPTNKASSKPAINAQSAYTEEYLRAGSTSKMAEVAAKQIFKLRESRMDILTGDASNTPRDGEALKITLEQLEAQEKALVQLFSGTTTQESLSAEFEVEPKADMEKEVLFRFSKHLGIVDADDLSGSPILLNLKSLDSVVEKTIDPKDKKKKDDNGIVYNIPGKASYQIIYGKDELSKGTLEIAQFGTTQILGTSLFEDKKAPIKVYFYPETGAIKQVLQ